MPVVISGTTGISGTDGSASTPALRGSDTNTGVYYGTDVVSIATNGTERAQVDSSGNLKLSTAATKILNSSGNPILQQTGSVLQVVTATTSTNVTSTLTSFVDTGLSATITPTSSTSKILVLVNQASAVLRVTVASAYYGISLVRGSTTILNPLSDGGGPYEVGVAASGTNGNRELYQRYTITYLDSPSTTSATTYKTQGAIAGSQTVSFQPTGTSVSATSTITLLEIAA